MDGRHPEEETGLLATLELNAGVHTGKERSSRLRLLVMVWRRVDDRNNPGSANPGAPGQASTLAARGFLCWWNDCPNCPAHDGLSEISSPGRKGLF